MNVDENKLKRVPPAFVMLLLIIFSLPTIAFHYLGMDFNALPDAVINSTAYNAQALELQIREYMRAAILQWSTFSLTTMVILLALIEYLFTRAKIVLGIAATQIVIAIYFITLPISTSSTPHLVSYALKLFIYILPFVCLLIHFVRTYNLMVEKQKNLYSQQKKLQYIATHDALTGLFNRQNFIDLLEESIKNGEKNQLVFAVFIIDIDNFKPINDTLGHQQGDVFIKQFTLKLTKLTRHGDILSRLGGDEFVLLATQIKSATTAKNVANRIIGGLHVPYPLDNEQLTTFSMGIAIYPFDGTSSAELLKNADIAMYKAKKSGKNTYRFHSEEYIPHATHA